MEKDNIIHDFNSGGGGGKNTQNVQKSPLLKGPLALFLVLAILGIGTGYILTEATGSSLPGGKVVHDGEVVEKGQVVGSPDEETFNDSAEGTLREGGIDGEGAYHLERPGGESQNVYLTSSVLDLEPFVGKKVKVWGETFAAEKAGWLMDVGRLQVL